MQKVVMTGGLGKVGRILYEDLKGEFDFTVLDIADPMPNHARYLSALDYDGLVEAFAGAAAVIHLAWNSQRENWRNNKIDPANKLMAENAFAAAVQAKVSRVIMASSIHADDWQHWDDDLLMSCDTETLPTSPYGATKVYLESLGYWFASRKGLQVICPRLGGVDPQDEVRDEAGYQKIFLSRRDCVCLFRRCLNAKMLPDGEFERFYAVSMNPGRVHDIENEIDWIPQDSSVPF